MTNVTHLCPRCGLLCGARCECGEDAIPRQPMPDGFTECPPRTFQPMLADSPPQTDLTMLAYHEVGPYPCPSEEEIEDEYD